MAISLSDFSHHRLLPPQINPKRTHFLFHASESSYQSNLSLKPSSSSKTLSRHRKTSKDTTQSKNLLCNSLFESIASQGHSLDIGKCAYLVKCLCKAGELDQAARFISLLESHSHSQYKEVLYNAFISGLCKNNQIIPALETLGRMRANGSQPNALTCIILASGLCSQGLLDLSFETVEHFKTHYEVLPNLEAYNKLLEGTILEKGAKEGLKLLVKMESHGLLPDETTFNSVARVVCKRGDLDEIHTILDGISACGVKLDIAAFCALVRVSLQNKHFGKVEKAVDEMLVKASNAQLNALVRKLCDEGLVDKVRALIEWLLKNHPIRRLKLCISVMHTFIKDGHPNKAIDFMDSIVSICGFSDIAVYNPILSGICNHGHVHQALEILDKLEKMGCSSDLATYNILINALWSIGDHVGSVEMVYQLLKKGFSPNDSTYGESTYVTLITCLCQDGMVDEANEIKRIMVENGHRVTKQIYDVMLLEFCKAGRANEAIGLFDEMLECDCEVDGRSMGNILKGLAHVGYEIEARKIIEEIVLRNLISPVKLLCVFLE
ncbi:hypothetical protein LUZ60_000864 [Juncus effusus]|nr:hypothetical protein LUZ60_000864 [Juncus effusus]